MAVVVLCFDRFTSEKKAPVFIVLAPEQVWTFWGENKNPWPLSEI
jgi:hypothetical protein